MPRSPREGAAPRRSYAAGMTEPKREEQFGVGDPDAFQRLWTPHRMAYIKGESKPTGLGPDDGCPFCEIPKMDDAEGLIVRRGEYAYARLHPHPYHSGHLLVLPFPHLTGYPPLDPAPTA